MQPLLLSGFVHPFNSLSLPDELKLFPFLESVPVNNSSGCLSLEQASKLYSEAHYTKCVAVLLFLLRANTQEPLTEIPSVQGSEMEGRCRTVVAILQMLQKCLGWLSIRDGGITDGSRIFNDINIICQAIGDNDLRASSHCGHSLFLQNRSEFSRAREQLEQALLMRPNARAKRFILEAKAQLAFRLGYYEQATAIYENVKALDLRLHVSDESVGLAIAGAGFAEAYARMGSAGPLSEIESGILMCRRARHVGFEWLLQRRLAELYLEQRNFEEASGVILALQRFVKEYGGEFVDMYIRTTILTTSVRILQQGGNAASMEAKTVFEQNEVFKWIYSVKWKRLKDVLLSAIHNLLAGNIFAAGALLGTLIEMFTYGLLEMASPSTVGHERMLRLVEKNQLLFKIGVFDAYMFRRFEHFRRLRNEVQHGKSETNSLLLKATMTTAELIQSIVWICEIGKRSQLEEFIPHKSLQIAEWDKYLGSILG